MPDTTTTRHTVAPDYTGPRFLGAPVGDFSVFQTILITLASGAASFFAATFLGIMTLLVMTGTGRKVDFSLAYRRVGVPVALFVLVVTAVYLGSLLVRRMQRQGANS